MAYTSTIALMARNIKRSGCTTTNTSLPGNPGYNLRMSDRKLLTDEQLWLITIAPAEVTDRQLADALGVSFSAVHNRRWQIRKNGWTCKVWYETCTYCGQTVTMSPNRSRTDKLYHEECRPRANRAFQRDRYHKKAETQRRQIQRATQASVHAIQDASIERANNKGQLSTANEDAYLVENLYRKPREVATELGRTYYGVESRMKRLRRGQSL